MAAVSLTTLTPNLFPSFKESFSIVHTIYDKMCPLELLKETHDLVHFFVLLSKFASPPPKKKIFSNLETLFASEEKQRETDTLI